MEQAQQQHQAGPPGLGDYLGVFRRRIWFVIVPFLMVFGLATVLAFLLPSQYKNMVTVEVRDRQLLDQFFKRVDFVLPHKPFLYTATKVIQSNEFLRDLVDAHGITEGFDVSDVRDRLRLYDRVVQNTKVKVFENKIGADIVEISYTGRDPAKVASFVNAVMNKYADYVMRVYKEEISLARNDLRDRYEAEGRRLKIAADAFQKFQQQYGAILVGDRLGSGKPVELNQLRRELDEEERNLVGLQKERDQVQVSIYQASNGIDLPTTQVQNQAFLDQQELVQKLDRELAGLLERFTENYPSVRTISGQLAIAREKLKTIPPTVPRTLSGSGDTVEADSLFDRRRRLDEEIAAATGRIQTLKLQITELEKIDAELPRLVREYEGLRMDLDNVQDRYIKLGDQVEAADGLWNRILSPAGGMFYYLRSPLADEAVNADPVFPDVPLFMGVGAFVGLLLGAGFAFVVEFTSRSFVTVTQVKRVLPLPMLGQIGELISTDEQRSRSRRRLVILAVALLALAALGLVHFWYFQKEMQPNLPTWLFKVMQRIYGVR